MNSSSGSSTVTFTTGDNSLANSQQLSSSIPSLSPNKKPSSEISKAYKHASQLFVTRRFAEALSVLEPVITPARQSNGYGDGDDHSPAQAPLAAATTTQRIKVWVLYITLLNSIVDLGQDDGKRLFGHIRYKEMVTCVRNGDIWETVVRDGYAGNEASVDAEVVYNLATLLLGQAPSQTSTQSRLESYLASSSQIYHDLPQYFDQHTSHPSHSHTNGTETPRDLTSRLKIIELFTLHVLPRNEEWEYARSFISMSDLLDDERRDSFLQFLQELQDVKNHESQDQVATFQQETDAKYRGQLEDKNKTDAESAAAQKKASAQSGSLHKRTSSEVDYGIDKQRPNGDSVSAPKMEKSAYPSHSVPTGTSGGSHLPAPAEAPRNRNIRKSSQKRPPTYVQQIQNVFGVMQNLVANMARSIGAKPAILFRMLISLLAIILALSRRDIRERVKRILGNGVDKVRGTVGMGVKVSYI